MQTIPCYQIKKHLKIIQVLFVCAVAGCYFGRTDDDLATFTDRTGSQVEKGFLPIEEGAERVLKAENIPAAKIKEILANLKGVHDAKTKLLTAPPEPVGKGIAA